MVRFASAIFSRGPDWKEVRGVIQKDLMSPAVVKQFVPGISEAARLASKGAQVPNTLVTPL
jgi:hypothetical protein